MANIVIDNSNLTNIANAIRAKTGTTTKYKPSEMAQAISGISTGTMEDLPAGALDITGDASYVFVNGQWDWFIEMFGSKIRGLSLADTAYMFGATGSQGSNLTSIPITLKFQGSSSLGTDASSMFRYCRRLTSLPTFTSFYPAKISGMFAGCERLREIPETIWNLSFAHKSESGEMSSVFWGCHSLRSIPVSLIRDMWGCSAKKSHLLRTFYGCYVLDEVKDFRPETFSSLNETTGNVFDSTFHMCMRLKDMTFYTGTLQSVTVWAGQTIDLSDYVGWAPKSNTDTYMFGYNSGITADKEVYDDATYQALKNDPDWWSKDVEYSRYNLTSAENTIRSLPRIPYGYQTTPNTIKFHSRAGAKTDGGAIGNLSEEVIASALDKGFTVAFVDF